MHLSRCRLHEERLHSIGHETRRSISDLIVRANSTLLALDVVLQTCPEWENHYLERETDG